MLVVAGDKMFAGEKMASLLWLVCGGIVYALLGACDVFIPIPIPLF